MEKKIEVGQRFGNLTVLSCHRSYYGKDYCFCRCDCGRKGIAVHFDRLINGDVISCGKCKLAPKIKIASKKSPYRNHPLYRVWSDMIMRCENPNRPYYHLYGGRGVKVCSEWRHNYEAFYHWAINNGYKFEPTDSISNGKRKRNKWSLDRIDVNGDYSPENCRWIDYKEQGKNRRYNMPIEINGETKTIIEWVHQSNSTILYFYELIKQGFTEKSAIEFLMQD
jgi:hypothetical protein